MDIKKQIHEAIGLINSLLITRESKDLIISYLKREIDNIKFEINNDYIDYKGKENIYTNKFFSKIQNKIINKRIFDLLISDYGIDEKYLKLSFYHLEYVNYDWFLFEEKYLVPNEEEYNYNSARKVYYFFSNDETYYKFKKFGNVINHEYNSDWYEPNYYELIKDKYIGKNKQIERLKRIILNSDDRREQFIKNLITDLYYKLKIDLKTPNWMRNAYYDTLSIRDSGYKKNIRDILEIEYEKLILEHEKTN